MSWKITTLLFITMVPTAIYSGTIWWITDLHLDINGDLLPSLPVCAWTPPSLFHSGHDMMSKEESNPDFIIVSGDFIHIPGRTADELSTKNILATIQTVTDLISETFSGIPVLPCIGNHEYSPSKSWPDNKWAKWLYVPLSKMWEEWLPSSSLEVFAEQGYYSVVYNTSSSTESLRIVALNTNSVSYTHLRAHET